MDNDKNFGFDNDKYLKLQSEQIKNRIHKFGGKLYLEFGGKLFDDYHASRVLPGFKPNSKITMLKELKDDAEIVIAINANDIEKNKVRGDSGITYDGEVLRLIDAFRGNDLYVGSVVLTQFNNQSKALAFEKKLDSIAIKHYRHYPIDGYPNNIDLIVSDEGYGKNEYIETERSLIVVTAPGPGSGKIATCLSQLYMDNKKGINAGYAKFETFPIWNLPLKHPVNLAYEAATADLNDVNMIDPYHLDKYGKIAINYNRDVEIFPVLSEILTLIMGSSPYNSPTDMGVNMAGYCIIDDEIVQKAANDEIIRRYYSILCQQRQDMNKEEEVTKIESIIKQAGLTSDDRPVIKAALEKEASTGGPAAAIMLSDGKIITGKTSSLLGAASSMLLNTLKYIANIPDDILLLSPTVIEPIQDLKINYLGNFNPRLHTDEVLVALAINAATNDTARRAMEALNSLRNSEMHSTVILSPVDINTLKKLGINITCEPIYQTKKLYHK